MFLLMHTEFIMRMLLKMKQITQKKNLKGSLIWRYLLLTRPYSWLDMVFTGILAYSIVENGNLTTIKSLLIAIICLTLWATLNWVSERTQQDIGRIRPDIKVIVIIFLIPFLLTAFLNLSGLIILFIYTIFGAIYPYKKTNKYLGTIGFLVRGIHTLSLFYLIAVLCKPFSELLNDRKFLIVGLSLFLIQSSRSLVADIRDIESDECEFPAKFGAIISFIIATILFVIPLFLLPIKNYILFLPLIVASLVFLCIFRKNLSVAAHCIHRIFVFNFVVFKMAISFEMSNMSLLIIILTTITGLLNITYLMVPRPSNRSVIEIIYDKENVTYRDLPKAKKG